MNKKLQRKIDNFNKKLQEAIDEMDGNNEFYYPAGDSIIGETDPIEKATIGVDVRNNDEEYTEYLLSVDGEDVSAYIYDDGTEDFDELDDILSYLKRRIRRTLKLWQMDGDAVDKELEKDSDSDDEE